MPEAQSRSLDDQLFSPEAQRAIDSLAELSQLEGETRAARLREVGGLLQKCGYLSEEASDPEIIAEYPQLAEEVVGICAEIAPTDAMGECVNEVGEISIAGGLPHYMGEEQENLSRKLRGVEEKLALLIEQSAGKNMSLEHRMGLANLKARLETARFRIDMPNNLNNPFKYLIIALEPFITLAREGMGTEEEVKDYMLRNLREIPRYLEQATELMKREVATGKKIYKGSLTMAKKYVPAIAGSIDESYKPILKGEGAAEKAAVKKAADDFEQFLKSLSEDEICDDSGFAVGEETLRNIYKHDRGLGDIEPAMIIETGKSEVKRLQENILSLKKKLSDRYGISLLCSIDAFIEQLKDHLHFAESLPDVTAAREEILTNIKKAFGLAEEFFTTVGKDIVPNGHCDIDVEHAPPYLQGYGFMVAFGDLFNPEGKVKHKYMVGVGDKTLKERDFQTSLENITAAAATHEVIPGHINQARVIAGHPDVATRTYGASCSLGMLEAWSTLSEEIAAESGFFEYAAEKFGMDPDILRLVFHLRQILIAGRAVVDTSLHSGTMTPAEGKEYFMTEALQTPEHACRQINMSINYPGMQSVYHTGYLHLKATRDLAVEILKDTMSETEARYWVYETFLSKCGFMPANLVTRYILAEAVKKTSGCAN